MIYSLSQKATWKCIKWSHFPYPISTEMAWIKTTLITPPHCTGTALIYFRLASSFKFKKGSEAAAKNDIGSSGSADPPMSHLLLPSEETIAGMNSNSTAVVIGKSKLPSNCEGESRDKGLPHITSATNEGEGSFGKAEVAKEVGWIF